MRDLSTLELLGLPPEFGVTLLVLFSILTLAPLFPDADFGILKIPSFTPKLLKKLKIIGPSGLTIVVLLHLPFWSKQGQKQAAPPEISTAQAGSITPRSKPTESKPSEKPESTGMAGKPRAEERPRKEREKSAPPRPTTAIGKNRYRCVPETILALGNLEVPNSEQCRRSLAANGAPPKGILDVRDFSYSWLSEGVACQCVVDSVTSEK